MELIPFKDKEGHNATAIHEPITKLAACNGGHFRVHIHFTKPREFLPPFGLLIINERCLKGIDVERIGKNYEQITDDRWPVLRNFQLSLPCPDVNEIMAMDVYVVNNPLRMVFRLSTFDFRTSSKGDFNKWTSWFCSEIPIHARLLIEISMEDCYIYNTQAFNLYFTGNLELCRPAYCPVCLNTEGKQHDFYGFSCGHGLCSFCFQKMRDKPNKNPCPLNCKNVTGIQRLIQRLGPCPIDGCSQDAKNAPSHYFMVPCGCILSHHWNGQDPTSLVDKHCPYMNCRTVITHVIKFYDIASDEEKLHLL